MWFAPGWGGRGHIVRITKSSPCGSSSAWNVPVLPGLEPSERYALPDLHSGEESTAGGRDLLEDGLAVALPPNSSRLIRDRAR